MQFPGVASSRLGLAVEGSEVHLSWTNGSTSAVSFVVVRITGGGRLERIAETRSECSASSRRWRSGLRSAGGAPGRSVFRKKGNRQPYEVRLVERHVHLEGLGSGVSLDERGVLGGDQGAARAVNWQRCAGFVGPPRSGPVPR